MSQGCRPGPPGLSGAFPGQAGNPVGFAATPAQQPAVWNGGTWPGAFSSLTAWPGGALTSGSPGNPTIYAFFDFLNQDPGLNGKSWITFVGCRFQSNANLGFGINIINSQNILWSYCSFVPLVSAHTDPPHAAWPCAASGLGITDVNGANSSQYLNYVISQNDSCQIWLNMQDSLSGPLLVDHCRSWGFGNCFWSLSTSTFQCSLTDSWLSDACDDSVTAANPTGEHTDGIGYLNNGGPVKNVLIKHNTIASLGSTNGIAMQSTGGSFYQGIHIINNYLSGFGNLIDSCHGRPTGDANASTTDIVVTDNVISTDLPWNFSFHYGDQSTTITTANGCTWRRNTFLIVPGGVYWGNYAGLQATWASTDNGKFIRPDGSTTPTATDYAG